MASLLWFCISLTEVITGLKWGFRIDCSGLSRRSQSSLRNAFKNLPVTTDF